MICSAPGILRRVAAPIIFVVTLATAIAAGDRKPFSTSTTLSYEATTLTKLLDELHYNHDAVKASDYANVVPDYMAEVDGQRLVFLGSDRAKFMEEYGKNVYYNIAFLGNINPAYDIFYGYQTRV